MSSSSSSSGSRPKHFLIAPTRKQIQRWEEMEEMEGTKRISPKKESERERKLVESKGEGKGIAVTEEKKERSSAETKRIKRSSIFSLVCSNKICMMVNCPNRGRFGINV